MRIRGDIPLSTSLAGSLALFEYGNWEMLQVIYPKLLKAEMGKALNVF